MQYASSLTSLQAWLCHCHIDPANQVIKVGMLVRGTTDEDAIVIDPDPDLTSTTQYKVKLPPGEEPQLFDVSLPYEIIPTDHSH